MTNMEAGVGEWLAVVEEALQGLHHALNNRIGLLQAIVELQQLGAPAPDGTMLKSLETDLARLVECNRMVRLIPREDTPGAEPLILADVVADVFAIHQFLHAVRDVSVTIVPNRFVEPVRVERWALVRVLTLLLRDAKLLAATAGAVVRVATESDEQWVRVELRVGAPLVAETPAARGSYAETIAARFGGTIQRGPGVVALKLPTLKARRAADKRAPG